MITIMAWRNIWRNKARSIIIIGSIIVGLFAGLFVLAIYKGMIAARIRTVIQDEVSHIQIHHPEFKKDYKAEFTIADGDVLIAALQQMKEVAGLSSRVVTQGMLANATGSAGVEIRGVSPEAEDHVSQMRKKILEGAYFPGERRNELLVGKKLADKKGLKLHAKVILTFSDKDKNITSGAFRITGIYQSTNTSLDERILYVQQKDLAGLLGMEEDEFHEVAVILKEDDFLEPMYQKLTNKYPGLQVETWKQIAPETELIVTVSNQSTFIIMIIIMLTLAFGIINTMLMAILERIKEIGMMVALGMNKIRLFLLVVLETVLLTLIGSPFGLFVAWMVIRYFSVKGIDTTSFAGSTMSGYGFEKIIYPQFPVDQIGKMMIIVTITAILSAIIPAIRTLRMEPADALRK